MKTAALTLLLSSGAAAFAPTSLSINTSTSTAASSQSDAKSKSALHVSVVRDILVSKTASSNTKQADNKDLLQDAFESQTPESVGVAGPELVEKKKSKTSSKKKKQKKRRKHNFGQLKHLQEDPDLDFFTLHSAAVSHLHKDMPVNDIVRAIKRAQNLHDAHDLATIAGFLVEHCDENWGFGYRGSLLSRLAVAALHCGQLDIAHQAIATRTRQERSSMLPHESAAIVRGLMRVGAIDEGWAVLQDELPAISSTMDDDDQESIRERLKHRSKALSSIASRHFYNGNPTMATKAMNQLAELGSIVEDSNVLGVEALEVPWERLVEAATLCSSNVVESCLVEVEDLAQVVWDTMSNFPCPNEEEECGLEDFLNVMP